MRPVYERNEREQRALAHEYLGLAHKAMAKNRPKHVSPIELIVNRYDSESDAVAVMLPVKEEERETRTMHGLLYQHCLKEFKKADKAVAEDSFEGYAVLRSDKKDLDLSKLVRVRKPLSNAHHFSLADNFSFEYRAQSGAKPGETEKEKIIKLARTVSLDKLYSLFPDVPKGTISATYSLVKMGAHDHDDRRKLTEADHKKIAQYVKEGKDRDWIAKKMKCNPFQVIASKARTSRKKAKRRKKK